MPSRGGETHLSPRLPISTRWQVLMAATFIQLFLPQRAVSSHKWVVCVRAIIHLRGVGNAGGMSLRFDDLQSCYDAAIFRGKLLDCLQIGNYRDGVYIWSRQSEEEGL